MSLLPPLGHVVAETPCGTFRFLNVEQRFDVDTLDWSAKDKSKLWRYNLHYFDYLRNENWPTEYRLQLILSWIDANPLGKEDAWEPYSVSVRIVNWVKFILSISPDNTVDKKILFSLYQQALWLERNIEYHILANHYMKNAVALYFAGLFFGGVDANRWLKKSRKILQKQLIEQFNNDGGHYECSPMYHILSVIDYLDVLNLAKHSKSLNESVFIKEVQHKMHKALDFMHEITLPNGNIPLFSDSAFGIAPTPTVVSRYAAELFAYQYEPKNNQMRLIECRQTGYYGIRKMEDMLLVDCGFMGPHYQPGHAHCDILSYELVLNGVHVIVDTGVNNYEISNSRTYSRSTRAHNTVVVEGVEQSEIWSGFRLARRARPLHAGIKKEQEHVVFEGAHDGYSKLGVTHQRRIQYDSDLNWSVTDLLQGEGRRAAESFIHLHPNNTIVQHENGEYLISDEHERHIAKIIVADDVHVETESGYYFPEFGVVKRNSVLVLSKTDNLPYSINYCIQKIDID